ncbi:PH domain-containing protein [Streptomyces sp. NPDC014646]|uniref:PH domain-containing protein n=1 Tax=Streptomyces sp. NPDC014646 TaxID=3364877 RepID=UPI0036F653C2
MGDTRDVACRPSQIRALWLLFGLGAIGTVLTALHVVYRGPDLWLGAGLLSMPLGIGALRLATAQVDADAHGLRFGTLLRRRRIPWRDVAGLHVHRKYANHHRIREVRRIGVVLRDGLRWLLPLPHAFSADAPDFDATLDALLALHRRYGATESTRVPVVSYRTAGGGWAGSLALCLLLLAGAGVAAWALPGTSSDERAWKSAVPCTATTPATKRTECLTTMSAVIERTDPDAPKKPSWVYFDDARPLTRLAVSPEAAQAFRPGDEVELTIWRGAVRTVAGEHHVWKEHMSGPGDLAVVAAACVLAAGYAGARVLTHVRGLRLPDDEVLPSALPFGLALVVTALWLLPFCYVHATALPSSPSAIAWAVAGSLATLGLFTWAWRASRLRTPEEAASPAASVRPRPAASPEPCAAPAATGRGAPTASEGPRASGEGEEEVFLAARFLEHTDYNPHGFGTHIVLGSGSPAVTPHPGPGRFAAIRIPVERLTVENVRRARGADGDAIPRSWHVAELDDVGTPVHLAAAPDDLARIVHELQPLKRAGEGSSEEVELGS